MPSCLASVTALASEISRNSKSVLRVPLIVDASLLSDVTALNLAAPGLNLIFKPLCIKYSVYNLLLKLILN